METLPANVTTVAPNKWDFSCNLEVDYSSEEVAGMVYAALAVDKELQPDKVKRHMSVSNGKLSVRFEAVEARFLRASYSAFVFCRCSYTCHQDNRRIWPGIDAVTSFTTV